MNASKLKDIMRFYGVPRPIRGTGTNGRIVNTDLENALGDYFFKLRFPENSEDRRHMLLRRTMSPMKAYRFNNLSKAQQEELLKDDNGWIGELKYDGWRMVITHIPGDRLHFFGGNLSTTEFLPVDYTYHLPELRLTYDKPCILDTEALCYDTVITQEGNATTNTREAVAAILGSGVENAVELQKNAKIVFKCFDVIHSKDESLSKRKSALADFCFAGTSISVAKYYKTGKKKVLSRFWNSNEEGMILKNISAGYDHGGRKRTHCIKIKKNAASLIGDTIDAFISGYILTSVHSYNDLIGGIELSVYVDEKPKVIATVTNLTDAMRYALTKIEKGMPVLVDDAYGKVLEIDGQELSSRNKLLMHAVLVTGEFRKDKTQYDCKLEAEDLGRKF